MSFSGLNFIFYFLPVFLAVYYLTPPQWHKVVLFVGSMGFYLWGAGWRDAALLFGVIVVNYALALLMERREQPRRRPLLALALCADLGLLLFYKYSGFLAGGIARLLGAESPLLTLALPLGISFYIFQCVAYVVDVYRGMPPEVNFYAFAAFLSAFPQLTMGPILRYGDLRAALRSRKMRCADLEEGFESFAVGFVLKVLVADQLAPLWASLERIGFASISTPLAWLGAVGYSLQLYFDFAGYSLMAVGLGQMLALPIARNFDHPYCARSVSEFWRRWHITLGAWFRDYLYIPLGGSRRGKGRMVLALTAVWLLTGLWHGAGWSFILWGAALLVLILLEKLALRRLLDRCGLLAHLYVCAVMPITWVLFKITDLRELGAYLGRMFPFFGEGVCVYRGDFAEHLSSYAPFLLLALFLCLPQPERVFEKYRGRWFVSVPLFLLFWYCLYLSSTAGGNAFLYARF